MSWSESLCSIRSASNPNVDTHLTKLAYTVFNKTKRYRLHVPTAQRLKSDKPHLYA